jgi:carbon-monoxide dehydrogenase large subunit
MSALAVEQVELTKYKWVGASVKRKEDSELIRGRGTYTDDVRLPGAVYVAFVRSPYAHARIKRVDVSRALAHPKVVGVLTPDEAVPLPSWMEFPGMRQVPRTSLAVGKVRFQGEPVVAVAATDRYAAEDAAQLVEVEYEPLPAVVDAERALEPGAPLLYEEWGDNVIYHGKAKFGDVEGSFSSADVVVEGTLVSNRHSPTPIEPRAITAHYDQARGILTIWATTQFPHVLKTYVSQVLGFPEDRIKVIAKRVGGGFGPKSHVYPDDVAVLQLALKLRRPVKWVETRTENLQVTGHARDWKIWYRGAFTKDGKLLAVSVKGIADFGVYGAFWTEIQPALVAQAQVPGPYKMRGFEFDLYCVATNKAPYAAHRGFGRPTGALIMERIMDAAARRLGLDPVEIRRRNLIGPDEMPYRQITNIVYDSGNYPRALETALRSFDYWGWRKRQEELRRQGRYIGIGVSTYVEYSAPSSKRLSEGLGWKVGGYDMVRLRVEPTGKVKFFTGQSTQGMSHETIFAQIVAEELQVHVDDVTVVEGDTDDTPYSYGAWASRATVVVGGAAVKAARMIREKMTKIAAFNLGVNPEDVDLARGWFYVRSNPSARISFREVARIAYQEVHRIPMDLEPGLEVVTTYEPQVYTTTSHAWHFVVVEVDPETGKVDILKYYVLEDAGIAVNPMTMHGQTHGAVAHEIGGTMYEELRYDENGNLLNSTFVDYLVPTALEIPNIEVEHIETPSPQLGGWKGMGEGGSIGAPAALFSAIEDALSPLGVKLDRAPLNPENILRAIKSAQGAVRR